MSVISMYLVRVLKVSKKHTSIQIRGGKTPRFLLYFSQVIYLVFEHTAFYLDYVLRTVLRRYQVLQRDCIMVVKLKCYNCCNLMAR